jgi:septin family protein
MDVCPDTIERRAINGEGRLGSLYDASRDLLLEKSCVKGFENPKFEEEFICHIYQCEQPNGIMKFFRAIKFDDALFQSILLGTVKPSGISSFINYSQSVDDNTLFLYYSYRFREDTLHVTAGKADRIVSLPSDVNNATHMITKIIWCFEIVCVIQNPNEQSAKEVENLLYPISRRLQKCDKSLVLSDKEERQIKNLSNVTIFGTETCVDKPNTPLLSVVTKIQDWLNSTNFHCPVLYTMYPLKWLYKNQQFSELCHFLDHDNLYIAQIEAMIIHLNACLKDLKQLFTNLPQNFISFTHHRWMKDFPKQFGLLLSTDEAFRTELRNRLVDVRRGSHKPMGIINIISDPRYLSLREPEINVFHAEVQQWSSKINLIKRLKDHNITYVNAVDVPRCQSSFLTNEDIDAALRNHFSQANDSVLLWCASDRLQREKTHEWDRLYHKLTLKGQQSASEVSLFYVDFSQCQRKLENFITLTLTKQSIPTPPQEPSSSTSSRLPQRSPPSVTDINVLLLGETGVGKSTFINAFVNYLMFDTLQQAEQSQPVVLIPVSFLITTGHQFDEFIVKFGDTDSNENHEHQGQSVTQYCKSYVFNLNDRLRLRLIDTPGMGDTRGVTQDELNIDHILTYINNLSHLNAVCLIFKPNASRLNIFFRSCVNQLLTYITPVGYNNIIFCFTNARSTFFAPGNTGPLLREMLKQEYHDDIQFQKQNTFCFDSESFRYLAAKKCKVDFDEFQTQECQKSWTISVNESVRLLNYIITREPYQLDGWQSPRKIALEISLLAQPLMETLRLILYNWKLRETGSIKKEIVIETDSVTTEICSNCAESKIVQVGPFHIVEYEPIKNVVTQHHLCPFDERHFSIEFTIKHTFVSQRIDASSEQFQKYFYDFLFKCDRIINFLQQKEVSNQGDPFRPVLERFLEEERQISESKNINQTMNKRIKETLRSMKQRRQQNKQDLLKSNEKLSLKDVYELIDQLKSVLSINTQIECIKTSRRSKMQVSEHHVKIPSIKNQRLTTFINSFQ